MKETVTVTWNGMECELTAEEWEDIRKGYLSLRDMFE